MERLKYILDKIKLTNFPYVLESSDDGNIMNIDIDNGTYPLSIQLEKFESEKEFTTIGFYISDDGTIIYEDEIVNFEPDSWKEQFDYLLYENLI